MDFDIKNKKIIFEYFEEVTKNNDNNNIAVDVNIGYKKKELRYINIYMIIKVEWLKTEMDKDDIDQITRKIFDKYKCINKIEKYKIEDIICTCAGDFQKTCEILDKNVI